MKNYTIVLLPENKITAEIENFRLLYTGSKLVDSMPPHITLKRRFTLSADFNEEALKNFFNNYQINKISVTFDKVYAVGNTLSLIADEKKIMEIKEANKNIVSLLSDKTLTQNPEWEGDNFKVHLALLRNPSNLKDVDLNQFQNRIFNFDRVCLYEIDPSPTRSFANQIHCKNLY